MSDRLVDDPDAVAVLAANVAGQTGVPASHVEKDFWVTEVLRGVAEAAKTGEVELVFKGGTSLSKAFSLIKRFSEDIDILVILPPGETKGVRDRILKSLVSGASAATGIEATTVSEATSKGSKRGARFHYKANAGGLGSGLSEGVFLELGSRGGAMPAIPMEITSLIAEHSTDQIGGFPEIEPVRVLVQAPWRTLVEKLVLLHTAHSADDSAAAIRVARHFYDVHQLVSRPEIIAGVHEIGIAMLARDVCTYSRSAELAAADRPAAGFGSSPAFNDGPHLGAARNEYERRVVGQLLWPSDSHPTFDDCLEAVRRCSGDL